MTFSYAMVIPKDKEKCGNFDRVSLFIVFIYGKEMQEWIHTWDIIGAVLLLEKVSLVSIYLIYV